MSVYVDSPISLVLMIQVPWYSGKAVNTVLLRWFNTSTVKHRRNNHISVTLKK